MIRHTFSGTCRKMIDTGKCDSDCCGIVPIPIDIYNKHKDKIVGAEVVEAADRYVVATKGICIP